MAYHADDVAKTLGKVLDEIPTSALKPSAATNAGRNLTESGAKSAGRVGGNSFDELPAVSFVSKSGKAADNGAQYLGKSSIVSRNADEGMDFGKQAVSKSPSKPVESKVTDLSDYRAKRAETKAVEEDLNFGKSANNNVQSMDMAEKMGSKSSNVVSMDVQAKSPIRGMEEATQLKKVSGGEGIDYDAIMKQQQSPMNSVVSNKISSTVDGGSEFTANAGRTMDTAVDGIPSASGVSRGTSSAGKLSPSNYPNPDPSMSKPPVRYEPTSIEEVIRMRQGKGPTTKLTHGEANIEAHHRQQIPVEVGGILDEIEFSVHRGAGNHTRHQGPSQLTPAQRSKEIRNHYKQRGSEYILPGEGI